MATALSYNQSHSTYDTKDNLICDCGRKCMSKTDLDQHKLNNCKTRSIPCSFCQEPQPSSTALRDHLMTCGNKTDQCPNCRKFIRRAVFAYHYENNCANLDETDTPTPRPRSSSAHRRSSKSNRPKSRENDINDHDQENNSPHDFSNYRTKTERIPSANRRSLNTVECEFCHNQCDRSDYEAHKETCLENSNNLSKLRRRSSPISKKTESRPSTSERRRSPETVGIPCEFCNEQIDLHLWSTHVQDCREREIRRIEARRETINREPVSDKLPCEHCEQLFSAEQLQRHEITCRKNPEYIAAAARRNNPSPLATVGLSNKPSKPERNLALLSTYSSLPSSLLSDYNHSSRSKDILDQTNDREQTTTLQNQRYLSHLTVHAKRTQDIMRPHDNDASALPISGHQSRRQRRASQDFSPQLINSSHDVDAHDTFSSLSNDHLFSGTQSLPRRLRRAASLDRIPLNKQSGSLRPMPRRTPSTSLRSESASRSSLDARGSHHSNATKAINHRLLQDDFIFHSPRDEDHKYQPKLNQRDRSTANNNKSNVKSSFYNLKPWRS